VNIDGGETWGNKTSARQNRVGVQICRAKSEPREEIKPGDGEGRDGRPPGDDVKTRGTLATVDALVSGDAALGRGALDARAAAVHRRHIRLRLLVVDVVVSDLSLEEAEELAGERPWRECEGAEGALR
jgi:hypothetical protein